MLKGKQISGCLGLEMWVVITKGHKGILRGDENVLS